MLVARNEMPTWPPSPQWAFTLVPLLQLSYSFLYWDFFGSLERGLNRALRGRPPVEEAAPRRDRREPEEVNAVGQPAEEEEEGFWPIINTIGDLIRGFIRNDGPIEVEVRVGAEIEDVDVPEDDGQDDIPAEFPEPRDAAPAEAPVVLAAPREQPLPPAQQERDQNQVQEGNRNDVNPPPPAENAQPPITTLNAIMNRMVSSLLFPAVCYGAGELLRLVVPQAWARPPGYRHPFTGLLQQRWGRSLVGGCLFVVLRDAFALYLKYRRVQVKQHRRVRNVDKSAARRGNGNGNGGAAIA